MAKKPQFGRLKTLGTGRRAFHPRSINWLGNYTLGDLLGSPLKYFSAYFGEALLNLIANQTNQYYLRTTGKELKTSMEEIRKFFVTSIIMANLKYPHIRMYWFKANRIDRIAESMPLNRYLKIRANIHVNAAIAPDSNNKTKFWKVEPIISAIRSACLQLPREENCAIDEQMIPFTGRVPAKEFIKSKLNPVGLKIYLLCGKSGRMLEFEIYQGDGTSVPTASKHLGLGGSVVMQLAQIVP